MAVRRERGFLSKRVWGLFCTALLASDVHCTPHGEPVAGAKTASSQTGEAQLERDFQERPLSQPACPEIIDPAIWPRAEEGEKGLAAAVPGSTGAIGHLEQRMIGKGAVKLRFFGTHVFDLLDKLHNEAEPKEQSQREMICHILNRVAERKAPVIRIWGTLKRTGTTDEIEKARTLLALLLDENARRTRPFRFIVTLQNHQAGYGHPSPEVPLDDQTKQGFSAKDMYLNESWKKPNIGQLADRIQQYSETGIFTSSPYILAWELVNELDLFRVIPGGSLAHAAAEKVASSFVIPAAEQMAAAFKQPIVIADIRASLDPAENYLQWSGRLIDQLSPAARKRLIWTSHVYTEKSTGALSGTASPNAVDKATLKLNRDLRIAARFQTPFLLGEIGEHVRDSNPVFCGETGVHNLSASFQSVLFPSPDPAGRAVIENALFWGEGHCNLPVDNAGSRRVHIGVGGDSADLGQSETDALRAILALREHRRFVAQ
ncbi:MAG: hypothetical protein IPK82_01415 [Polyangiaceae bacterium]|nr:hypothetical protein [Polyangiaceae bacterium]